MHGTVVGLANVRMDRVTVQGKFERWNIISKRIFVDSHVHRYRNFGDFNGLISIASTKYFTPHQARGNGRNRWLVNSINRITCGRIIKEDPLGTVADLDTVGFRFLLGSRSPFDVESIG